jgi:glycerol-3-phosphate acyltransferase PlsY
MIAWLAAAAIGFAAGSVPFAWLVHRAATGRDLRLEGSGNPGATNVERSAGRTWGIAALGLDAGKGAAGVLVARWLVGVGAGLPAAAGAVVGHVFSPWLAGKGGKGVAAAAGAFAVVAPAATALACAVFAIVVARTRYVAAGSAAAAVALPAAVLLIGPGRREAAVAAAVAALIAWRHRENFARMRAGTEPRVGSR